ncbi:hypothetical protein I547_7153 [Mycobacterium kansasii 824]|nr:hypothetical protein I547_7153 [Mycobacterium kansasii 824]
MSATAAAQRAGHLGEAHVRVIRDFVRHLPVEVDIETLEKAEAHLARLATRFRPDQLAKLAQRLMDCLNPDGTFTDEDRARRRGLTLGKQGLDGMSRLTGWLTPEARAGLDAVLAKLAAPGMCNPQDESPVVDGPPPKTWRSATPARKASAPTMASTPHCAGCWHQEISVSTTGYRPASSCPPRSKSWNRHPVRPSRAVAPCCRCQM